MIDRKQQSKWAKYKISPLESCEYSKILFQVFSAVLKVRTVVASNDKLFSCIKLFIPENHREKKVLAMKETIKPFKGKYSSHEILLRQEQKLISQTIEASLWTKAILPEKLSALRGVYY